MSFKAVIEIPAYSKYKYEMDKESGILILDRPLNQHIPHNYGFIPETLAEDQDPLDVFIITESPLVPGSHCKINLMGIMICNDNGIPDHKIIATLKDENLTSYWPLQLERIVRYLKTYKNGFEYHLFSNEIDARHEIETCQKRYLSKS
jgi:inorganic pyrophosphatase